MDVGGQCTLDDCRQIDLLPFTCRYCQKIYCLDHREQSSHNCSNINNQNGAQGRSKSEGFPIYVYDKVPKTIRRCPVVGCQTQLNLANEFECKVCHKTVCLHHRFEDAHGCQTKQIEDKAQPKKRKGFFFCCGSNNSKKKK